MSDVINDLIIESVKGLGATALTITHDMASARKIADKIAMLYKGKSSGRERSRKWIKPTILMSASLLTDVHRGRLKSRFSYG